MRKLFIVPLLLVTALVPLFGFGAEAAAPIELDTVYVNQFTRAVSVSPSAYTVAVDTDGATFHASRYTGELRYFGNQQPNSSYVAVPNGAEVCVNQYTGQISYFFGRECGNGYLPALL